MVMFIPQPLVTRKTRVPDYFHVMASYAMPALLSALLSVLFAWLASEQDYGLTMYEIFPERSPRANTSDFEEIADLLPRLRAGHGRSAAEQAFFQLLTALTTLLFACTSGVLVGLCLRTPWLEPLARGAALNDASHWHVHHVATGAGGSVDAEVSDAIDSSHVPETGRTQSFI